METWLGVYPFVEVEVEGVKGHALLDTGASLTVIDDDFAERAELRTRGRISVRGTGGRQRGRKARDVRLALCGRKVSGLNPVVIDLEYVEERFGRPIDAIIGGDIFEKVLLDLDYPNERVALRLPGENTHLPELGTRRVPLGSVGETRRSASLTLASHGVVRLLVDTGAGGEVSIYTKHAERLGLPAKGAPRTSRLGGGIGGKREQWLTVVEGAQFAGEALGEIEVRIPREQGGRRETQGLLGGGILARFRVLFDLSGSEMTLVGPSASYVPNRDRLGLQAEWSRGGMRILHISKGSPAERAGWRKGERIVAIDGEPPTSQNWRELIRRTVSQPAGTRVVLVPARGEPRASVLADLAAWGVGGS